MRTADLEIGRAYIMRVGRVGMLLEIGEEACKLKKANRRGTVVTVPPQDIVRIAFPADVHRNYRAVMFPDRPDPMPTAYAQIAELSAQLVERMYRQEGESRDSSDSENCLPPGFRRGSGDAIVEAATGYCNRGYTERCVASACIVRESDGQWFCNCNSCRRSRGPYPDQPHSLSGRVMEYRTVADIAALDIPLDTSQPF